MSSFSCSTPPAGGAADVKCFVAVEGGRLGGRIPDT